MPELQTAPSKQQLLQQLIDQIYQESIALGITESPTDPAMNHYLLETKHLLPTVRQLVWVRYSSPVSLHDLTAPEGDFNTNIKPQTETLIRSGQTQIQGSYTKPNTSIKATTVFRITRLFPGIKHVEPAISSNRQPKPIVITHQDYPFQVTPPSLYTETINNL